MRLRNAPLWGLFFALFLFACRTAPPLSDSGAHTREIDDFFPGEIRENPPWLPLGSPDGEIGGWTGGEAGGWAAFFNWEVPRTGVKNFALRIDLAQPGLRVTAYPAPEDVDENGVFAAKKPEDFARETGAAVVINAAPFKAPGGFLSKKRSLVGVFRNGGKEISKPEARYAALAFLPDNRAVVIHSQAKGIPVDAALVAGGFFPILQNGEILRQKAVSLDARCACGVSADGKTLYVLTAQGRGGAFSRGMTYEECAAALKAFGAWNALQFDGGSSASLVVSGRVLVQSPGVIPGSLLGFALTRGKGEKD